MQTQSPGQSLSSRIEVQLPLVHDVRDAEAVCGRIESTMETLLQLIEAETMLLRSGQRLAAGEIESRKRDFARQYMIDLGIVRAIGPLLERFAPDSVGRLRHLHEEFRSVLQINMAALAAAKALAEAEAKRQPGRRPMRSAA